MFYREAGNDGGKILFLLHGSAFSSANWLKKRNFRDRRTNTIQTIAAGGFKVYAVDLPGKSDFLSQNPLL